MAYGAGAGGAAYGAAVDLACTHMRDAILEITNSPHFIISEFSERKLTLSQAYCILWQDTHSGDVSGRKSDPDKQAGATACCLLDLYVMGRLQVEVVPNSTLGIKHTDVLLKVIDDRPTGTYLDDAIFDSMLKHQREKPEEPRKLKKWIETDLYHWSSKRLCVSKTLDSIVDVGILGKKDKLLSSTYPTVKPEPERQLAEEIQKIVLEGVEPDAYMRTLLTVICAADKDILKKCFKEQFDDAKKKLKAMFGAKSTSREKYQTLSDVKH